jgi:hypothetical protein
MRIFRQNIIVSVTTICFLNFFGAAYFSARAAIPIQPDMYQGLADVNLREVKAANLTDGGAYLCLSTSNLH